MNLLERWLAAQRGMLGPDWRWQLAQRHAHGSPVGNQLCDDPDLRAAIDYIHGLALGTWISPAEEVSSGPIAAASGIYQNHTLTTQLKTLVIAGMDRSEIVDLVGVDQEVIRTWEALYFDVRPVLRATDWIVSKIILPEEVGGNGQLASQFRLAYAAGPVAARAVVTLVDPLPFASAERLLARSLKLHLRFDRAASAHAPADDFAYVKFYSTLRMQTKKLELEKERLAERCRQALHRHELAQERLRRTDYARQQRAERKAQQAAMAKRLQEQAARARQQRHQEALRQAAASPLAQLRWMISEPVKDPMSPQATPVIQLGEVHIDQLLLTNNAFALLEPDLPDFTQVNKLRLEIRC